METENSTSKLIWMGLGIFERLYSEKKIRRYFAALDKLPNPKLFLLADEITGTNNFVLNGKKYDMAKDADLLTRYKERAHEKFLPKYDFIQDLIKSSANPSNWRVEYWNYISRAPEYQELPQKLHSSINQFENHYLKKEVIKVTIFGFGARLRKNFTNSFVEFVLDKDFYRYLETLSEYTIEEISATIYLAGQKAIKAGHDEERGYDDLSKMFYERLNKEYFHLEEPPRFYYF